MLGYHLNRFMDIYVVTEEQKIALINTLQQIFEPTNLSSVIACAVPLSDVVFPRTALLHVKFNEDKPLVEALARLLWRQCVHYALPRKRRLAFQEAVKSDLTVAANIIQAVRDVFITFNEKYPARASEVGEVLAYCVTTDYLRAPQMAAKMSLKTSPNMPVHGLDGIHAAFVSNDLTIYFLESKLSKSANDGAREYAESVSAFLKSDKQYLREYEIVSELGNLDSLEGKAREAALEYFDIIGKPNIPRRERSVGVICYSEVNHFANIIPVTDGDIKIHENHFTNNYITEQNHHYQAALKHLKERGADPNKCIIFFVAVPDVDKLRELFYQEMGISTTIPAPPKRTRVTKPRQRKGQEK